MRGRVSLISPADQAVGSGRPSGQPDVRMVVYPAAAWPRVAPAWPELVRASRQCSVFLTEAWVQTWIEVFAPLLDVSVAVFESADGPVGACLLVKSTSRRAMIPLRRVSLNAAGEPAADTTYIEFNDLLCRAGWEEAVAGRLAGFLIGQDWDEFTLDGFTLGPAYEALKQALAQFDLEEDRQPSYHVDLSALRRSGTAYETALHSDSRRSVRRSLRFYSEAGPLRLEPAANLDAALAILDDLAEMNRRRWEGCGRDVVFASPYFIAFHQGLIRRCFSEGSVQLLRLTAGTQTVGLLYSLVHAGKVCLYQCGYDYSVDKRLSPGTLTLCCAIQHYLDCGYEDCDFLSGDAAYKRRLSTGSRSLVWAVFRRPGLKVHILDVARTGKRWWLRNVLHKARTVSRSKAHNL